MVGMALEFESWSSFRAGRTGEKRRWLERVAKESEAAFRKGMGHFPPVSAPGAWPNTRTGRLLGSIRTRVTDTEVTISTNTHYSMFLRHGTSKMGRRKMSDNALEEGLRAAGRMGRWVGWVHGSP